MNDSCVKLAAYDHYMKEIYAVYYAYFHCILPVTTLNEKAATILTQKKLLT